MTVTLIAAVARNGTVGMGNHLVWRHRDDLRRFKALTTGRTLLMGRRTFESIGRALPGRRTIVLSRDPTWSAEGVETAGSLAVALELAGGDVVVAGGGDLYAQTLGLADELKLTHVDADLDGDTTFPYLDPTGWRAVRREDREGYRWVDYERARRGTEPGSLRPRRHDGEWVFVEVPGPSPDHLATVASVREGNGTSVVVARADAECAGLAWTYPAAWITLEIETELAVVGLTARFATALAEAGLSCNVVAGRRHDHLFVPHDRAEEAMAVLDGLSAPGVPT